MLDAHRQVFEAFIHSFTTYRPLLLKVRAAYEEALQDALTSQADNIHMKAQLAVLHQRKVSISGLTHLSCVSPVALAKYCSHAEACCHFQWMIPKSVHCALHR